MKIRYKIICGLSALLLAAGLSACDNDKPSIEAVNPSQNTQQPADNTPPENTPRTPGFAAGDLALDIEGTPIKLGADINDIIAILGEDYDFSEAISCAYDGMDKTYIYPGLELYTYPEGKSDFLFEATLTDDSFATAAGLRVGSTEEEIRAVYGENCFKEGIVLRYNTSNNPDNIDEPSIYFVIEDQKATSIGIALGERVF